jgi:hypothetical protein
MPLGPRWQRIHTYVVYELFGIPRERWLNCLPWQTTANYEEQMRIQRFLSRYRKNPHPEGQGKETPPPEGGGKMRKR